MSRKGGNRKHLAINLHQIKLVLSYLHEVASICVTGAKFHTSGHLEKLKTAISPQWFDLSAQHVAW